MGDDVELYTDDGRERGSATGCIFCASNRTGKAASPAVRSPISLRRRRPGLPDHHGRLRGDQWLRIEGLVRAASKPRTTTTTRSWRRRSRTAWPRRLPNACTSACARSGATAAMKICCTESIHEKYSRHPAGAGLSGMSRSCRRLFDAAVAALEHFNVVLPPQQIDIYQLGAMALPSTGESSEADLQSSAVKQRVPESIRLIIEPAPGCDGKLRFSKSVEQFSTQLRGSRRHRTSPEIVQRIRNSRKSQSDTSPRARGVLASRLGHHRCRQLTGQRTILAPTYRFKGSVIAQFRHAFGSGRCLFGTKCSLYFERLRLKVTLLVNRTSFDGFESSCSKPSNEVRLTSKFGRQNFDATCRLSERSQPNRHRPFRPARCVTESRNDRAFETVWMGG